MAGELILIVDDEPDIGRLLTLYLTKEGFRTLHALNAQRAIELVHQQVPDLIILDVLLPDEDGIQVCSLLRKEIDVPIIFLSCKGEDVDKVAGLVVGGDDYVTKPFSPREIVARVKAHIRRYRTLTSAKGGGKPQMISFRGLQIDLVGRTVRVNNAVVPLSFKEFELLALLAQNPDRVFSADELFERLWKADSLGDTRTVMVHISSLRKKIENNPAAPEYILTVRGAGYKFNGMLLD